MKKKIKKRIQLIKFTRAETKKYATVYAVSIVTNTGDLQKIWESRKYPSKKIYKI